MNKIVYVVDDIGIDEALERFNPIQCHGSFLQVFLTRSVESVHDYSLLSYSAIQSGSTLDRISRPYYIGNCDEEDIEQAKTSYLKCAYPGFEVKKLP